LSALAGSATERFGALLRIETGAGIGYSDLHPWPELGDQDLRAQLAALIVGKPFSLGERSLALAELDRTSRSSGHSAFAGLPLSPSNHRLIIDRDTELVGDEGMDFLQQLVVDGVQTLKLKLSSDWRHEAAFLTKLSERLHSFRLRLDFNGQLRREEFFMFVESLPLSLRESLEFVEDPIAFEIGSWNELVPQSPVPIALDRSGENLAAQAPWMIWKPARQEPCIAQDRARRGSKVSVTSYLDHPVGQIGAALEASRLMTCGVELQVGGLASHFSYEKNEFSESLVCHGGILLPVPGTGIGFDELLAAQNWRELK
jgi:O-succinylbenzoate synthase